jgi:CHAD domain-containing protein
MNERLETMRSLVQAVRLNEDVEAVHKMRVATRRLRAAMSLFQPCLPARRFRSWRREVRGITKALGGARDLDVQILFVEEFLGGLQEKKYVPGVQRLLLRLRQRRDRIQAGVLRAMDDAESSDLFSKMGQTLREILVQGRLADASTTSVLVLEFARSAIRRRLGEMLSYETAISTPERVEELHAMRIAAKRLRYCLEVFSPLYEGAMAGPLKSTRRTQTLLGDIHDCDVWTDRLPGFIEKERKRTLEYFGTTRAFRRIRPGLVHLADERRRRRERLYSTFLETWKSVEKKRVWESLSEILDAAAGSGRPEPESGGDQPAES